MNRSEKYREAREKGLRWLLEKRNPDGSFGPVEKGVFYYRMPWTLGVCGETGAAMGLVEWIRENMFTAEGNFDGQFGRGDYEIVYYPYPGANLVYGAQILRQFDISYRGIEFLRGLQDAESGGVYDEKGQKRAGARQDMAVSSQVGLAALATGQMDMARKVGGFLARCYELQPEVGERLYFQYSREKGLITEFAEESQVAHVVEGQGTRQWYFVPGLCAAFLGRLYMATGNKDHLELARRYEEFAFGCTERQFEVPQVCKTGWGSAVLYLITKERKYREWTERVGDYYVETQQADGHWVNIEPYTGLYQNIEITAEFVMHLDTIMGVLAT